MTTTIIEIDAVPLWVDFVKKNFAINEKEKGFLLCVWREEKNHETKIQNFFAINESDFVLFSFFVTLKHRHHNAHCRIRVRPVQLLYRRHLNVVHKVCNKNSQHETPNLVHALPIPMNSVPYHIEHIVVMKTIYKTRRNSTETWKRRRRKRRRQQQDNKWKKAVKELNAQDIIHTISD